MTSDTELARGSKDSAQGPKRVLIYTVGSLGDTLLTIPALHALRQHFPDARFILMSNRQAGGKNVLARDLLLPVGLCDDEITYAVREGYLGALLNRISKVFLLLRLRLRGYDAVAYLVERFQGDPRLARDARFFRLAGISRAMGMDGLEPAPRERGLAIRATAHRVDELLNRLAASGVEVPSAGLGRVGFETGGADAAEFEVWRSSLPPASERPWVAIGPGSKMPAKVWPFHHFSTLVQRLMAHFDFWPVIFGGAEDRVTGERLIASWGKGSVAAGALGIRASAVGLRNSVLYIGNDTGTMHLAASVATPCLAIFSARESPGRWEPYGTGHTVLRAAIDCAGCQLEHCLERRNECLMRVTVDQAFDACVTMLKRANISSRS